MINTHDLCYQCSKDGSIMFFVIMRIGDFKDETYFPAKRKLISCEIKMKIMLRKIMQQQKIKYNMNIHKAMRILIFVAVNPKMHVNWTILIVYGYHFLTKACGW